MAGNSPEEIAKVKQAFIIVGIILGVCTVLTVMVAVVPSFDRGEHGLDMPDIIIGLSIATFKASCVAAIFMHLCFGGKWEKKTILWSFFGSLFFAGTMLGLIALADFNPITFKGNLPQGSSLPETQRDQAYDPITLESMLVLKTPVKTSAVNTEEVKKADSTTPANTEAPKEVLPEAKEKAKAN